MVCFDHGNFDPCQRPYCCAYASRRKSGTYLNSWDDIFANYSENIVMSREMPEALSGAMGDWAFLARFATEEEAVAFCNYVIKKG